MNKYRLFTPVKKFYLTYNWIFLFSYSFIIISAMTLKRIFPNERFPILEIIFSIFLVLIFGLFPFAWFSIREDIYKPLKGTLHTNFELTKENIIIETTSCPLSTIKNIDIYNFDIKGDLEQARRGDYNGLLSNGIGNLFKIYLTDGKIIDLNFQQDYEHQIIFAKELLFHYYKLKKISYRTLARVFDCTEDIDHERFQKKLPKIEVPLNT